MYTRTSWLTELEAPTNNLRAAPFNITVAAYAPVSDYDDNQVERVYDQLQNVIDVTPKKDILVVQGD